MDRLPFDIGRVVRSTQGRDEGRWFVVIRPEDDGFVWMADGLTRKLEHLKKKKTKHLKPKPIRMEDVQIKLEKHQLLDSDLRRFLDANGLGIEQPLCKED